QLAVRALRALREDIQDQLRSIDDLEIALLRDRGALRRRELAIEDEHVRVELHGAHDDVVELPFAEHEARIDALAELDHDVADLDAGRARELAELTGALVGAVRGSAIGFVRDVDQDRAPVLAADLTRALPPRE